MEKIIVLFMIFTAGCLVACKSKNTSTDKGQKAQNTSLHEQLLQVQERRIKAINEGDTLEVKAGLHPQFQFINALGQILPTNKYLIKISSQKNANSTEKCYTKSHQSYFYNHESIGIMHGICIIEKKSAQGIIVLTSRYSDLYLKSQQNWLLLNSQHTRISQSN